LFCQKKVIPLQNRVYTKSIYPFMKNTALSKSKYTKHCQCPKALWLGVNKPGEATIDAGLEARFADGNVVGDLAMGLFGDFVEVTTHKTDGRLDLAAMIQRTSDEMQRGTDVICEASFSYVADGAQSNYCAVDILRKTPGGWAIYEVKSTTSHVADCALTNDKYVEKIQKYAVDVAYQKWVLENCGVNVTGTYLVTLNSDYVRDGELDVQGLFNVIDIKELVNNEYSKVKAQASLAHNTLAMQDEPAVAISPDCHNPYKCEFWEYCTKQAGLDLANDKEKVRLEAEKCGIAVPKTYTNGEIPSEFPVIIKPRCGEKFGLSAKERYVIVKNPKAYKTAYEKMAKYGSDPIVQQLVMGQGVGISLLMNNGKALSAICHKRIREYPQSGGPSACCESFYDEKLVRASEKLLASMHFNGFAMVEYKCSKDENYLLEINPRIWGSFPLTEKSGATFADDYVKLSSGEDIIHPLDNYKCKVRMNFVLSDLAACLDLMRHGRLISAAGGLFDIITRRAKDALRDKNDPEVLKSYYKLKLKRGDDK
jgi:hypothetical protein